MTGDKKIMKGCLAILFALLAVCVSCGRSYNEEDLTLQTESPGQKAQRQEAEKQAQLIKTNRVLLQKEKERIASYAGRRGWSLREVRGAYVEITDHGDGRGLKQGERIAVDYTCELLNGESVYSSQKDGKLQMQIGKAAECPLGLQLVLETLSNGARARVVVPYNLAYGLSGDGKRVPKSASLVYVLSVEKLK